MAEGDRTALRVQLLSRHAQFLDAVAGLGSEGLVDLKNVNVVHRQTCSFEGSRDSKGWTDTHNLRGNTSNREANDSANDAAPVSIGEISARQQNARGAISHLTRVSGSGSAILLESRLQFGKTFDGGLGSDTVILVHSDRSLVAVLVLYNGVVWSDLSLEKSRCSCSLLVAGGCHSVLGGAINSEFFGDILRGDSHRHETVVGCLTVEDTLTKKVRVDLVGHHSIAHRLEATANADLDLTSANGVRYRGDSLKTRAAEAVDARDAGRLRVASHEHGHTGVRGG